MQHIAAALELVAGDGHVGKEDGDGAEHARSLVVARLKQVGQRELGKFPRTRRNKVDEQQTEPAAGRLPERGESVFVGVLSAGKEGARADPRSEQGEHKNHGRERAAGDQVIGLGFDADGAEDGHGQQRGGYGNEHNDVERRQQDASSASLMGAV